jgi:hypothetical protein
VLRIRIRDPVPFQSLKVHDCPIRAAYTVPYPGTLHVEKLIYSSPPAPLTSPAPLHFTPGPPHFTPGPPSGRSCLELRSAPGQPISSSLQTYSLSLVYIGYSGVQGILCTFSVHIRLNHASQFRKPDEVHDQLYHDDALCPGGGGGEGN